MASDCKQVAAAADTTRYISQEMEYLDTCRPEFYYNCDWNGARIIAMFQQMIYLIIL